MNIGRQRCPKLIVYQTQRSILNILHFALDYFLYEFHEDSDQISEKSFVHGWVCENIIFWYTDYHEYLKNATTIPEKRRDHLMR